MIRKTCRHCGQTYQNDRLTKREAAIVALLGEGRTNPEIANALCVEYGTVRSHLNHIYAKTGRNRLQLGIAAARGELGG